MAPSLSTTISYITAGSFTYDAVEVEFTGSLARLLLLSASQAFNEDVSDDTGWTYTASSTEFTGGLVQQKSQRPTDATFGATYTSAVDAPWGDGSLVGVATGSPPTPAGTLDLRGGTKKYADYDGTSNASTAVQQMTVKCKITPNYTTKPSAWMSFWSVAGSNNSLVNRIELRQSSSAGQLQIRANNSAGTSIGTFTLANWVTTAGTEYEVETNIDLDTGNIRVFIDGVLHGSVTGATGTRSNSIGLLRVGNDYNANEVANFQIADFVVFDTVQHTTNYTPGYTLQESDYLGDTITPPQFSHAGPGSILTLVGLTNTEAGAPRYTVRVDADSYQYWTGSAWAASDGTYAQANTAADFTANAATFPGASGALTADVRLHTTAENTQTSLSDLALNYTGHTGYSTDGPTILVNSGQLMDALYSFEADSSASGSDSVTFALQVDGSTKYWDGASWVASDSTVAQSNSAADINANASALDVSDGATIKLKAILHSDDGTTTPTVTSATMGYDFFVSDAADAPVCTVYGWLSDFEGSGRKGVSVKATGTAAPASPRYIMGDPVTTRTDASGYFEITLAQGIAYAITLDGRPISSVTVPASDTATFLSLLA